MKTFILQIIILSLVHNAAFASKMCNLAMKPEATPGLGMKPNAAAVVVEEFIAHKALLGTVQMVSLLLGAKKSNDFYDIDGNKYKNLIRRSAPDLKKAAESFKGFNEQDKKDQRRLVEYSIASLDKLVQIVEKSKVERDADLKEIRSTLMFSFESANDLLNTLLYIRDLKINDPKKYQAFLVAWESSLPVVAEFALQAVKPTAHQEATAWAWSNIALITSSALTGAHSLGSMAPEVYFPIMFASGIFGFLGSIMVTNAAPPILKVLYYRTKSLSASVHRGMVKSKVKALLQRTLALPDAEAQAAIASESPKQSKLLDQTQDLSREGLKKVLSEDAALDTREIEDLQKLSILNMRIMSAVSDQAVLLKERKDSHQDRFDTLVTQLDKLDQIPETEKRSAMIESHNLQVELSEIVVDGKSQHDLISAFEKRIEANLAVLKQGHVNADVERLQSQLLMQQSILKGMNDALTSAQNNLKTQLGLLNQMALSIMVNRVK